MFKLGTCRYTNKFAFCMRDEWHSLWASCLIRRRQDPPPRRASRTKLQKSISSRRVTDPSRGFHVILACYPIRIAHLGWMERHGSSSTFVVDASTKFGQELAHSAPPLPPAPRSTHKTPLLSSHFAFLSSSTSKSKESQRHSLSHTSTLHALDSAKHQSNDGQGNRYRLGESSHLFHTPLSNSG